LNLISISVDPVVDTPERLAEWSRNFGNSGPEWILLTGTKADVDRLLKALQIFTPEKQDHAPVVLIGGEGVEQWVRAPALLPLPRLAGVIRAQLTAAAKQVGMVH
jgi:protein SCO1/2